MIRHNIGHPNIGITEDNKNSNGAAGLLVPGNDGSKSRKNWIRKIDFKICIIRPSCYFYFQELIISTYFKLIKRSTHYKTYRFVKTLYVCTFSIYLIKKHSFQYHKQTISKQLKFILKRHLGVFAILWSDFDRAKHFYTILESIFPVVEY